VLGDAGWWGPSGEKIDATKGGGLTNMGYDPPNRSGVHGVLVETHRDAAPKTKAAAEALIKVLNSLGLFAYHNNSDLAGVSVPSDDVIVITVARRLPL
jgi:hypothetical protein